MTFPVRWRVATLLFLGGMLNYLDRSAISIASPAIKTELSLSSDQLGVVFSSFFAGYAVLNLVGGWAADRFGAKKTLTLAILAWSLFCGMTATATGFLSLVVVRVLFGAAEGPFGAASAKIVHSCFPKREIASAIALGASGTPVGALIAGPLVAVLVATCGWRLALVAVAGIGILFALGWNLIQWVEAAEDDHAVETVAPTSPSAGTKDAGSNRAAMEQSRIAPMGRSAFLDPVILANAAAYFAYTYLLAMYLSWLPIFFVTRHHLDLRQAAFGSSAPWIMGFVGIWVGAAISDALFRRRGRLLASRRVPQVGGLVVAAIGTGLLGWAESTAAAVGIASIALFALYVSGTSFWAIVQDVVAGEQVGRVSGFTHLIANLGGVLSPALTGAIIQRTNHFEWAWLLGCGLTLLATLAVLVSARHRA